jgi:hypothetical protein
MMLLVAVFLALVVWLVPKLFRLAKSGFQMLRSRLGGKPSPGPT